MRWRENHQGPLALGIQQLGELLQSLGHLTPLAAAQVDDDVRASDHLPAGAGSWSCPRRRGRGWWRRPFPMGKAGVDDPLPGDQRPVDGQPLGDGGGGADGPPLGQGQGVDPPVVGELHQSVADPDVSAGATFGDPPTPRRAPDSGGLTGESPGRRYRVRQGRERRLPLHGGDIPRLLLVQGGMFSPRPMKGLPPGLNDLGGGRQCRRRCWSACRAQGDGAKAGAPGFTTGWPGLRGRPCPRRPDGVPSGPH